MKTSAITAPSFLRDHVCVVAALAVLAFIWAPYVASLPLTTNVSWLLTVMERLLAGGTALNDAYEANPPLAQWLYALPALLHMHLGLAPGAAVYLYALILTGLSALAGYRLLRLCPPYAAQADFLTAAFLLAVCSVFTFDFAEREMFIVLGLWPFIIAQYLITLKVPFGRVQGPLVLLAGCLAVLIKPHYGLIPVFFLFHRMFYTRRVWSLTRDPDFIALAACTILYAAVCLVFFHDYIAAIFPDFLEIYLAYQPFDYQSGAEWTLFFVLAVTLVGLGFLIKPDFDSGRLVAALGGVALLCFVCNATQMKAFNYHLLPTLVFFFLALAILIRAGMDRWLKAIPARSLLILILLATVTFFTVRPGAGVETIAQLRASPLAQKIAACPKPCTFLLFGNKANQYKLALYTGTEVGSRFYSFHWFLPRLLRDEYLQQKGESTMSRAAFDRLAAKYAGFVTEDFARYKPGLLLLADMAQAEGEKDVVFQDFFLRHAPGFSDIWKHYRCDENLTVWDTGPFTIAQRKQGVQSVRYTICRRLDEGASAP